MITNLSFICNKIQICSSKLCLQQCRFSTELLKKISLYFTSYRCFKQKQSLLCLMTCIIQETHGRWAKNHFIKFFVHLNYKKPYLIGAYTIGNAKQGSEEYTIRRGWCNLRDQLKYAQNNKSNPILQKGQRV